MGKVIAIVNQKGGVGKTTTSVNLSSCLGYKKRKVLLIDIDPQGNATSGLGIDKEKIEKSIYDVLINNIPIADTIKSTPIKNLSLCPSNIELAGAEVELVNMISRETRLKIALDKLKDNYDYIFIDCPPSLGLLTLNSLTAADSILIPIQCEYYALEGLSQLINTVDLIRQHLNPKLEIEGVLLTMYNTRTNLSEQVVLEVKKYFKENVFDTIIPRNTRLSEAPSHGLPIILYDAKSRGCECYLDLAKEITKITKKGR